MKDVVIVGGGPAGLATAILAAQRGLDCKVIEARRPPLDKACGEGLMPPGARLLEGMGISLPPAEAPAFRGIRFLEGRRVVAARFPWGAGLGIRRPILMKALQERARGLGVELLHGVHAGTFEEGRNAVRLETSRGSVAARWLVGADGLGSRVGRRIGCGERRARRRRLGVRRHFAVEPWTDLVEVHWGPGCEAYVTPVGPRCVGVAMLSADPRPRFADLLARLPALALELRGARELSRLRGAGPFGRRVRRRARGRVALVGDAAGFVDPVSGDGLTIAFTGAALLAGVLQAGDGLERYDRALPSRVRRWVLFTRLLVALTDRPRLRGLVMSLLARHPAVFSRLLGQAVGPEPATDGPTASPPAALPRDVARGI